LQNNTRIIGVKLNDINLKFCN